LNLIASAYPYDALADAPRGGPEASPRTKNIGRTNSISLLPGRARPPAIE
jgi:hypothetical protein